MRTITMIVIHCSATREGTRYPFAECRRDHIANRRFKDIGYHYYIDREGVIWPGRPEQQVGAHCRNHNKHSIGVCYEGGLDRQGRPKDTRTQAQKTAMKCLLEYLREQYPKALVLGHHDLNPAKECPSFDVSSELELCGMWSVKC